MVEVSGRHWATGEAGVSAHVGVDVDVAGHELLELRDSVRDSGRCALSAVVAGVDLAGSVGAYLDRVSKWATGGVGACSVAA